MKNCIKASKLRKLENEKAMHYFIRAMIKKAKSFSFNKEIKKVDSASS